MPTQVLPQTYGASGSFTLVPQAGDAQVFIGVSGSPGGFTLQLQGVASSQGSIPGGPVAPSPLVASAVYDMGLFNSDFAGPFAGPVSVTSFPAGYYASVRNFGLVIVTWTLTSGTVVIEAETGFFQLSSPTQIVGAVGFTGNEYNLLLDDMNVLAREPGTLGFNKIPYSANPATRPSPLDLVPHNT